MIYNCPDLEDAIEAWGILPLLPVGIPGWSAEEQAAEECQYTPSPEGGWEWPLWKWKGGAIQETGCAYGKFIMGKAAFISKRLWPDFCNWRRYVSPKIAEGSIEENILFALEENGSMITRDLRKVCGFDGPKMRGKFDAYVTRLQNAGYIVTEDFVYPQDKNGKEYGWGWALLTTAVHRFGKEACSPQRTPAESHDILMGHLRHILPDVGDALMERILKRKPGH